MPGFLFSNLTHRGRTILANCLAGAATWAAICLQIGDDAGLTIDLLAGLRAATLGALIASVLTAGLFGRQIWKAGLGAILSTGLGATIGGVLFLGPAGALLGAPMTALLIVDHPATLGVWVLGMALVHAVAETENG